MVKKNHRVIELIKSKKILIFDFDGVIVDSASVKSNAFAELYSQFGNDLRQKILEHHKKDGGISRFEKFKHYHSVFLKKEISQNEMDLLDKRFSNLVVDKVINSTYIAGVIRFLKYHSNNSKKLIINSATPQNELLEIVNRMNINHYFDCIFGSPDTKTKNLIKSLSGFNLSDAVFFGDAKSDLDAAEELEIDFIGVGEHMMEVMDSDIYKHGLIKSFKELL